MKKYRNGTELRNNASFPFSCQGQKIMWASGNGKLIFSWHRSLFSLILKERGRSLWFLHCWDGVVCLLLQVPSILRSKIQQEQDDKSCTCTPPVFPEASVLHALSWKEDAHSSKGWQLQPLEGLPVWNQKPLHNVKYYHHFTGKEVDSEVKWLSL